MTVPLPHLSQRGRTGLDPVEKKARLPDAWMASSRKQIRPSQTNPNIDTFTKQMEKLTRALQKRRINICTLQETRWRGVKNDDIDNDKSDNLLTDKRIDVNHISTEKLALSPFTPTLLTFEATPPVSATPLPITPLGVVALYTWGSRHESAAKPHRRLSDTKGSRDGPIFRDNSWRSRFWSAYLLFAPLYKFHGGCYSW